MISIVDYSALKKLPKECGLFFYATWMPRSISSHMYRVVDSIESEFNIKFFGIDVDSFKSLIKIYEVKQVPTIILMKDGISAKCIEGYVLTSAVRSSIREAFSKTDI